ncbi:MAG: PfkB family carbohydrate kinase [Saprospiraceae bacterium]
MSKLVLTFGEMLFDDLPSGRRPGGGPFNTAAHLAALGTPSAIITAVGTDESGDALLRIAGDHNVGTGYIQRSFLETGSVKVQLNAKGEAEYDILEPVAWDDIHPPSSLPSSDAIAFWMLGVRHPTSRKALKEVLAKVRRSSQDGTEAEAPRFVDLGIRKEYFDAPLIDWLLKEATVAKLNEEELQIICDTLSIEASPEVLAKAYNLETVVVTLGSEGAYSWRNGIKTTATSPKVKVVDTVGCGDAFLAGYIHHRLQGDDEQVCIENACARGSYAATLQGGLP